MFSVANARGWVFISYIMESRAKVLGHPLHQILIVFPLGLLATSTVFDGIAKATGNRHWSEASCSMMGAGVTTALVAVVPGVIDFIAVPQGTRAKRIGLLHGVGNLVATSLYLGSWMARRKRPSRPSRSAIAVSTAATLLAVVTGWLGGELVDRLGIGVDDDAHADAPNSLRERRSRWGDWKLAS